MERRDLGRNDHDFSGGPRFEKLSQKNVILSMGRSAPLPLKKIKAGLVGVKIIPFPLPVKNLSTARAAFEEIEFSC